MSALTEAQNAIATSSLNVQEVMQNVAQSVCRLIGADGAAIGNVVGNSVMGQASFGEISGVGVQAPLDNSLTGQAIRSGRVLTSDDTETDPRVDREACRKVEARSLIVAPLSHEGRFAWTLSVWSRKTDAFSLQDEQAINLISGLIGAVIGRAVEFEAKHDALAALSESENRFKSAFSFSPIGVALVAPEGRWLQTNHRLCEIVGYSAEELCERSVQDLTHPDDLSTQKAQVKAVLAGEQTRVEIETRVFHRDGSIVWVASSGSVVRDASGTPVHLIWHVQDITQRKNAERELTVARDEAERANEAKSIFLSRMSHELRTPMNAILGFAQLMEMDAVSADQEESVAHILSAGRHLLKLINEVLDLARIEAGKLSLSPEAVLFDEVLQDSISMVMGDAESRGITIGPLDALCDVYVMADHQRLQQVLLNLLSNAVKYNRDGGHISFSCEVLEPRSVCLSLSDSGIGISEEKISRLFKPFERLGAENTTIEGTGLGLALSRTLCEAMDATLDVESTEGEGTTFLLTLPLAKNPSAAVNEYSTGDSKAVSSVPYKVLYIEDNVSNSRVVSQIFKQQPHIELHTTSTAEAGLLLATQYLPDLILLDLHLPDASGEDTLQRLRQPPLRATFLWS
jgi:PAS domain S-box-containing protein